MTGLEQFETYLKQEQNRITLLQGILMNSRDQESLEIQKTLVEEIIYHFEIFVKREHERVEVN